MPRADGADPTASARQARRRARLQAQEEAEAVTLRQVLAAVLELGRKVDNLVESVDNRDVTPRGVTSRSEGATARARTRGVAPAPTGPGGHYPPGDMSRVTPWDPDLASVVLESMRGHGANSAGAIRDHLGASGREAPLGDVVAALVHLRAGGQVIREEGDLVLQRPDTWRAVDGAMATLELVAERVQVTPAPDLHVTCRDYLAHQSSHHWDDALQAFVCPSCAPVPVTPGGLVNGHV